MKGHVFYTVIGAIGGIMSYLLGGWSAGMQALVLAMVVDYTSGLLVAAVFKNSTKTESGGLESKAGMKGLCRKAMILFIVMLMHMVDVMLGVHFVRDAVITGFLANELVSIVENAGLMGLPLPQAVTNAIDVLKKKEESVGEK